MKLFFAAFLVFLQAALVSAATPSATAPSPRKSIYCATAESAEFDLSFEAKQIRYAKRDGTGLYLGDVTAKYYLPHDPDKFEEGRRASLRHDENYSPRKYADYYRLKLTNLVSPTDFDDYYPGDSCRVNVLLPKNVMEQTLFETPAFFHCDQSGGKVMLECALN